MTEELFKYPRTPHIEGSRKQSGDEDLDFVPFSEIKGRHVVVEEKIDGANCAISFSENGDLLLQSRGHYLTGGGREKHFNLLKQWANAHSSAFFDAIGDQHVVYGEWLYAKHTVFYDDLPHLFLEFDVLDKSSGKFLDTPSRAKLLSDLPICGAPVLFSGALSSLEELESLVGPSKFITSSNKETLETLCLQRGLDADKISSETDLSGTMEGLYIKVEEHGEVVSRLKHVRASFLQVILESDSHWLSRPIIPNQLRPTADIFAP